MILQNKEITQTFKLGADVGQLFVYPLDFRFFAFA